MRYRNNNGYSSLREFNKELHDVIRERDSLITALEMQELKTAMYAACFFLTTDNSVEGLSKKLSEQIQENKDAMIGEFDGFSYASWRARAVYRNLENMVEEGILTPNEYCKCKTYIR